MSTLDDWTDAMCAELGLDPKDVNIKTVLNLARVAAHTVDRPAAPLTAYVLGIAVGRGEPLAETAAKLQQLARGWSADTEPADTEPADTEPTDTEPADTEPADTEPAGH